MVQASPDKAKKNAVSIYELVDIEKVRIQAPQEAAKRFELKAKPKIIHCDLLIVGGGMGGIAATLASLNKKIRVCLTEESSWLGGQMTAQGVSALDENYLVETSGASRSYKQLREAIRNYYRALGARDGGARFGPYLDPGNCWVSRLAFEPKVAIVKINELLESADENKDLQILFRTKALAGKVSKGKLRSVLMVNLDTGKFIEVRCKFCIDATEFGDLLPLAGITYVSGVESQKETQEEHAPPSANAENVQDFTYPFVVEFRPGENHIIAKPPLYDRLKEQGKFSLFGYKMFENNKVVDTDGNVVEYLPFWQYRRIIAGENFSQGFSNDLSMINWESNDWRGENIIDKKPEEVTERLARAKSVSLGFLYWLQTEVPRDDGGQGYPEILLRTDVLDTDDGLAKHPYIRESRRIKAVHTVVENDIAKTYNNNSRAQLFFDSLGIGLYPIDIHGHQDVPGTGQATRPFQIPGSALVQTEVKNLLPGCKNIGTTHITNGAYRLHPIEWSAGEAAGTLAAFSLVHHKTPLRILQNKRFLRQVQNELVQAGVPVFWYDDISAEHPAFAAAQFLAVTGILKASDSDLHFRPDDFVTRTEAACAVARLLRIDNTTGKELEAADLNRQDVSFQAISRCLDEGLFSLDNKGLFHPEDSITREDLQALLKHRLVRLKVQLSEAEPPSRAQFANLLYEIVQSKKFLGKH